MAITRDLWIVLRARDEASRIVRSFGMNISGAAGSAAASVSAFDRAMATTALRLDQFAKTAMLTGGIMAGFGVAGLTFIKSATDVAAEYDRQVRRTMTQIDGISTSLEEIANVGRKVAAEVEIPFEQMQETLFFIFSSMNVSVAQAETLLRGFAKEAVAGQTNIESAARTTIAIINSLGLSVDDLSRIQDVQFQIVRKGIITYEELANTIGRALPAAARAGQSFETLGGMIAFLTRNGLSAAMAATSAARALESMAHPKTVARLEDMGIAVRNAKGEFLPLVQIMEKMNKKLSKMASPERAKFLQELFTGAGGTIQARRFWDVAFKNFDQFEEMIGFMSNASGVFEEAYGTMADSVAAKSQLISNKWMLIKEALGRAVLPHLLVLMGYLGQVLDWFNKLPEGTKQIIAQFILWGSVISIVVGALVILTGTIAFFMSAIIAGGATLAIIMASIAAVTVALLGFIAAVTIAWQRSEDFKNAVKDLGAVFKVIRDEVVSTVQEVAKTFNDKLMPSIDKLVEIIETKGLPAVREFMRIWVEEVVPKLDEAKRVIVDIVKVAMERMAIVIDNYLVPALNKMNDWWVKNSDSIRPLLAVGAQVVKWLLIITALIAASGLLTIPVMIMATVDTIVFLIAALKQIWEWIKVAATAVGDFFVEVWNRITKIGSALIEFWRPIWESVAGLVKAAMGVIAAIVQLGVTLVLEIWKDWVKPLIDIVTAAWKFIFQFLKVIWDMIVASADYIGGKIREFWDKHMGGVTEGTTKTWKKVTDFISDKVDWIKKFFEGSKNWLYNAGVNIITGLIDGVTNKLNDLKDLLKKITDLIPKIKGPKPVDLKLLVPAGQNIMKGFISGIASQVPMLKDKLRGITQQIGQIPTPTVSVPDGFTRQTPEQRNVTQNITVNTQEINPRVHAMELGWELEGRV